MDVDDKASVIGRSESENGTFSSSRVSEDAPMVLDLETQQECHEEEHQQEQDEAVGLSSASELSQARRRMLDLVNKLHSTGVQVDIDLPRIAVVGSQSAGKSSLIESISGITLPRASGTCTRCPIECRLSSSSESWRCAVSLRFVTDSRGQPLGQARNRKFGRTIYDKSLVEDRIRRAQRAVLNPKVKNVKLFLEGEIDDEVEGADDSLSFSHNCVCVEISGPDVADLSFCDLPGLIATSVSSGASDGTDSMTMVESLVTSYIKTPSCLILLTVACETDFENQAAHHLAKQYDPTGKRTIGVLTKPDRIPTGEENSWLPFIFNEKEPLENNWYCVKQPSSNDLKSNMTWAKARKAEDKYFSSTAPWSEIEPRYQRYLRTSNLVDRLSYVLSDLIAKRLPQIYEELDKTTAATQKALSALPRAPSSNPQTEISAMIHAFVTDLDRQLEGVPDEDGLIQAIRPAQERFRRAIRETAPNFRPFEKKYEGKQHLRKAKFLVQEEGQVLDGEDSEDDITDDEDEDSDEDEDEDESEVADKRGSGDDESSDSEEDDPRPSSSALLAGKAGGKLPPVGVKRKHSSSCSDKVYIDEVSHAANRARTRELPGHFPFSVQQSFIEKIIKLWREPAVDFSKTVDKEIARHLTKLISKHFKGFGQGLLEQRVKNIMHQHLQKCMAATDDKITWLLRVEERPFSLNTHYLSDYREKFVAFYKEERRRYTQPMSSTSANVEVVNEALALLAKAGHPGITREGLWKLHASDKMEPALAIMADVRAYFQVAYKRFADNLPLAVDLELVHGVGKDALPLLCERLGINGRNSHAICMELAQETVQVADKRADLEKRLERLEGARTELDNVGLW